MIDVGSEKHFDEGPDDDGHQMNPFDDADNELAFEASGIVPLESDSTLFKSQEVSDTVAIFVTKITSMNLSREGAVNDKDKEKDISVLLRSVHLRPAFCTMYSSAYLTTCSSRFL